jgi:hypothetical protein
MLAWDIRGGKTRGGEAFRDTITGYEFGVNLSGYIDSVEFWLDARIFSEGHANKNGKSWVSWDREFLETQGHRDIPGDDVLYSSYARYRGHIAMRMGWAVLDFARDAQHQCSQLNNLIKNLFFAFNILATNEEP